MMSDEDPKSWVYAGGLPYELTEGDLVCVFSQYGEIFEISLARDKDTGKSRGFCFIKYEDPKSCELAVDNLNGGLIVGRKIKVSYPSNLNFVKTRKPAVVAPNEGDTQTNTVALPKVVPPPKIEFDERETEESHTEDRKRKEYHSEHIKRENNYREDRERREYDRKKKDYDSVDRKRKESHGEDRRRKEHHSEDRKKKDYDSQDRKRRHHDSEDRKRRHHDSHDRKRKNYDSPERKRKEHHSDERSKKTTRTR